MISVFREAFSAFRAASSALTALETSTAEALCCLETEMVTTSSPLKRAMLSWSFSLS